MDTEVRAVLSADSGPFTAGMKQAEKALEKFDGKTKQSGNSLLRLAGLIGTVTAATAFFGRRAFQAATDLDEMVITMNAVGKATGIGSERISEAARAIEAMGIEMAESRRIAVQFAQNQLDLAQAAGLARVAQDLAVVSQSNSTQTLQRLVRGIQTGNSVLLRGAGITTLASEMYRRYADELGVVVGSLTPAQRQQAIINGIMREGTMVAGAYEQSMDNAGKVLRSFPRILQNIRIAFGNTFLTGMNEVILSTYRLTQSFAEAISITPKLNKETGEVEDKVGGLVNAMRALETVFSAVIAPISKALARLRDWVETVQMSEDQALRFANRLAPILPVLVSFASALSAVAAVTLLRFIPGLRMLAPAISPGLVALVAFVGTSTQVQEALGRVWAAAQPVIDAVRNLGQRVGEMAIVIAGQVVPAVLGLIEGLLSVLKPMLDWMASTELGETLTLGLVGALVLLKAGMGAKLLGAFRAVAAAKVAMGVSATYASAAVTLLGNAIRVALIKTGIGIAIVAIGMLVAWFAKAWSTSQEFRDAVVDLANKMVGGFEWVINTILRMSPLFILLYTAFVNLRRIIVENADKIRDTFNAIRDTWRSFVDRIRTTVRPIMEWFSNLANRVIEASEAMANAWIKFKNIIRPGWLKIPQVEFGRFSRSIISETDEMSDAMKYFTDLIERIERPGSAEDLARQAEIAAMMENTLDGAAGAASRLAEQLRRVNQVAYEFGRWALDVVDLRDPISKATDEIAYQFGKFSDALSDTTKSADELVQGFSTLVSTVRSQLGQALSYARQQLAKAQQAFDDFANAIQTAIMGTLNFGQALQAGSGLIVAFEGLRNTVGGALSSLIEFRTLATAPQSRQYVGFVKALSDALSVLEKTVEESFLGRLRQRRDQIREFGESLQMLAEMGISEAALRQISATGYEAGLSMARELIAGGQDAIQDVNLLTDEVMSLVETLSTDVADRFYEGGGKTGSEFLDGLMEQAEQAEDFAAKIRRLIEMGLEPAAIRQVLAAGREAGSRIADELIAGGTTVVDKVNEMYKAVEKVAKDTGLFGAREFFQAGVDAGQALVDGIVSAIRANESRINDLLMQLVAKLKALEAQTAAAAAAAANKAIRDTGSLPVVTGPKGPVPYDPRVLSESQAQDIVNMDLSNLSQQLRNLRLPSMGGSAPTRTMAPLPTLPSGLQWGSGGLPDVSAVSTRPSVVINQTNNITSPTAASTLLNQQNWLIQQALR